VFQSHREVLDKNDNKTHSFRERFFKILCRYRYVAVCASVKALRNFIQRTSFQNCSCSKTERVDCQKLSAAVGYRQCIHVEESCAVTKLVASSTTRVPY